MKSEKGAVTVLVALLAVALMGMAALAVDAGVLYVNKRSLQLAADLAALAGAQELPDRPDQARTVARATLLANGVSHGEVGAITFNSENTEIQVTTGRNVGLYFARVLGYSESGLSASARARVEGVSKVFGVVPWGIEAETEPYQYGEEYVLKWNADNHEPPLTGNYHILDLSGSMTGPQYADWVANGYDGGTISVGQMIETKTGHLGTHTEDGVTERMALAEGYDCDPPDPESSCPLIVIVPIVKTFVDMNGKGEVEVVGFARFLITRMEADNKSKNQTVYGVFLERLEQMEVDPNATYVGLKRVVLIQ